MSQVVGVAPAPTEGRSEVHPPAEPAMHGLTLRFPEPLEAAFQAEHFAGSLLPIRAAFLLGAACLLIGWPLNEALLVERAPVARPVLLLVTMVVLALAAFTYSRYFRRWAWLCLVVAYLQFALYPLVLLQVRDPELAAVGTLATVVLLIFLLTISRLPFPYAAATGLVLVGVWLGALAQPGMAPPQLAVAYTALLLAAFGGTLAAGYFLERASRRDFLQQRLLAEERAKSDRLLYQMLPEPVALRLRERPDALAESVPEVTVVFADLVGFTPLSERLAPVKLVELLNRLFSDFDALVAAHGLEKIKTIGDGYHAVAGLPVPHPDHAEAAAAVALGMQVAVRRLAEETQLPLRLRVGIHTGGPVVAGVIGRTKFVYEVWGDTVNTASRMESHGLPERIQVSEATAERLRGRYVLEERGVVDVKGKGPMRTFWLDKQLGDDALEGRDEISARPVSAG